MTPTETKTRQSHHGHSPRKRLHGALVLAALALASGPGAAQDCADVDLVLAIDGSGSIDAAEFSLQRQGYAAAFRRADVQGALQAAGVVDVTVLLWGDSEFAVQVLPWMRIRDAGSAERLAAEIGQMDRMVQGNTGLGRALWVALDLLSQPEQCGHRKIVNVSGDGQETVAPQSRGNIPLPMARSRAEEMGVTVNALAIENEVNDLADWYQDRLLVGPGSFVMRVNGFDSFAEGISKKLIREIAPPDVAHLPSTAADGET